MNEMFALALAEDLLGAYNHNRTTPFECCPMFRVALIAYLSLTTVLGPALCCCNARQLFSLVGGSKCCGKPVARRSNAQLAHDSGHDHQHGPARHRHEHSPTPSATKTNTTPVPNDPDNKHCPCGNHHARLVAANTDGVQMKAVERQNQAWFALVSWLPVLVESDTEHGRLIPHQRPAALYGREMLRAYQIMRC